MRISDLKILIEKFPESAVVLLDDPNENNYLSPKFVFENSPGGEFLYISGNYEEYFKGAAS